MSKKQPLTPIDFDFGVGEIIPATQEAYRSDELDGLVRKTEKEGLTVFKSTVGSVIDSKLESSEQFPSDGEVFVLLCNILLPKTSTEDAMWIIWRKQFLIY